MTTKVTPFGVDLTYGDNKGADNWNIWTDLNYTKLSALSQIAIEGFVASLPAPDNGKRYILTTTDEVVADYELTHHYTPAFAGLRVLDKSDSSHWFFDGTTWLDEDDYGDLPAILACLYPMDATLLEIQAVTPSISAIPVMTDAFQTGTLTIQGGLGSNWETVAAPTLTPPGPATALFDTGVKKFEWAYTMPNLTGAAVDDDLGWMYLGLFYVSNFAQGLVHIYINTTVTAGVQLTKLKVFRLGVDVSGYITVPRTGNIAVVLDANTATFSVEINSGLVTLSDDTYTIANPCILSMNLNERYGVEAEHAGKTMSASLITTGAGMFYTAPLGATTICGLPL